MVGGVQARYEAVVIGKGLGWEDRFHKGWMHSSGGKFKEVWCVESVKIIWVQTIYRYENYRARSLSVVTGLQYKGNEHNCEKTQCPLEVSPNHNRLMLSAERMLSIKL